MFRFEDPQYFYLLLLVPLFVALFVYARFKSLRQMRLFGNKSLLLPLMPDRSPRKRLVKFILQLACFVLLVVMLARPQVGVGLSTSKSKGFEAVIALDVSNSMLARDMEPSRLDAAKQMIAGMVDKMSNDRVGLIVFAGEAYTQLPITSDYISARMFLDAISPSMVSSQGTDIARAIRLAEKSFTQTKGVGKGIIIITDGENHEGGAEEAARQAAKDGYKIFIVGVGSEHGAPVPDPAHAGQYLHDENGQTVLSRLNTDMCKRIAREGHGQYIYLDNAVIANQKLMNALNQLEKKESSVATYNAYDEQFQWIALIALFLLMLDSCLLERKNRFFNKINLFRRHGKN